MKTQAFFDSIFGPELEKNEFRIEIRPIRVDRKEEAPEKVEPSTTTTAPETVKSEITAEGSTAVVSDTPVRKNLVRGRSYKSTTRQVAETIDQFNKVQTFRDNHNVYFGVLPRRDGKSDKHDIPMLTCIWLDLDLKKDHELDLVKTTGIARVKTKEEALARIKEYRLTPTAIVDSGHGYHVYWRLTEPIVLPTVTKDANGKIIASAERDYIQNQIRAFQAMFAGDTTSDFSRILRVPTTLNVKKETAIECTIEMLDPQKAYSFSELIATIPSNVMNMTLSPAMRSDAAKSIDRFFDGPNRIIDEAAMKKLVPSKILLQAQGLNKNSFFGKDTSTLEAEASSTAIVDALKGMRDGIASNANSKVEPKKMDRSINDFSVAVQLYDAGFNDAEVYSCFQIFRELKWFAGEKASIRAPEYLTTHTLPSAKSASIYTLLERLQAYDSIEDKKAVIEEGIGILAGKDFQTHEKFAALVAAESPGLKKDHIMKLTTARAKYYFNNDPRFYSFTLTQGVTIELNKLIDYFKKAYHIKVIDGLLYIYQDGVYTADPQEGRLKTMIYSLLSPELIMNTSMRNIKNLKEAICDASIFTAEQCEIAFNQYSHLINLKNGMYDTELNKLVDHSPDYLSFAQLNVTYDPNAKSELLDKFLSSVFLNRVETIDAFSSYCLMPTAVQRRFLLLIGTGTNGKSVWMNFLTKTLGKGNCSSETIQSLANNKFSLANLRHKLANISSDVSEAMLNDVAIIKRLTGGDTISTEKKFKDSQTYENYAKLIFSCNEFPALQHIDEAYFGRMLIINCLAKFTKENQDLQIQSKLDNAVVRSAWFNRTIAYYKSVNKDGDFKETPEARRKAMIDYREQVDSVLLFLNRTTEPRPGSTLIASDLYRVYTTWIQEKHGKPVSELTFIRRALHDVTGVVSNIDHVSKYDENTIFKNRGLKEPYATKFGNLLNNSLTIRNSDGSTLTVKGN